MTSSGHIRMTFDNGYTVSIFNGFGSYTENHFKVKYADLEKNMDVYSNHVEIAIQKDGKFVTKKVLGTPDDVEEMVTIDELMEILNKVQRIGE